MGLPSLRLTVTTFGIFRSQCPKDTEALSHAVTSKYAKVRILSEELSDSQTVPDERLSHILPSTS